MPEQRQKSPYVLHSTPQETPFERLKVGIAAHEIGHALGFFHTQARYDRDEYITVNKANIKKDWTPDFDKQDEEDNNNYDLTYDYGSIMHYGSYSSIAAVNKKQRIMNANDGNYTATLGSDIISFYDLLMMNKLYDCLDKCNENKPDCQNDGFAHPRDCSKCVCPSGFGGPLCDKKPSNCGEELVATDSWQTVEKTLEAGEEGEDRDEYKRCTYWIKAPENVDNAKIEVKIAELPEEFNKDGCIYAGVEIKAREDKRLTGYRFCSQDDVGIELSSNSKIVPVIVYSGSRKKPFSTKLDYRYTL
ncbi:astacin [Teladorsagia circumcincta]|uniref:Metalloendopeptidase n=1 Tax=Teladorsagia circumcincta TaxID=45464 RepID=A0A2G9UYT9_TELCI|nr:astacin [Teladorsagia circumcincta]